MSWRCGSGHDGGRADRARRLLANLNEATLDLPRWHAVINHEPGVKQGNEITRIPDATAPGTVDQVQQRLYRQYATGRPEPRLFDGSRAPLFRARSWCCGACGTGSAGEP